MPASTLQFIYHLEHDSRRNLQTAKQSLINVINRGCFANYLALENDPTFIKYWKSKLVKEMCKLSAHSECQPGDRYCIMDRLLALFARDDIAIKNIQCRFDMLLKRRTSELLSEREAINMVRYFYLFVQYNSRLCVKVLYPTSDHRNYVINLIDYGLPRHYVIYDVSIHKHFSHKIRECTLVLQGQGNIISDLVFIILLYTNYIANTPAALKRYFKSNAKAFKKLILRA